MGNIFWIPLIWVLSLLLLIWGSLSFGGSKTKVLEAEQLLVLENAVKTSPTKVELRQRLATQYYMIKNWQKVIETLEPVTENLSNSSLNQLVVAYFIKNDLAGAQTVEQVLLSKKNLSVFALETTVEISNRLLAKGQLGSQQRKARINKTLEVLEKGRKRFPKKYVVYDLSLNFQEKYMGNFTYSGIRILEDLKKHLEFKEHHYTLECRLHADAGYTEKAYKACQEAIDDDPENEKNFITFASVMMAMGQEKKGGRMLASLGKKFNKSPDAQRVTAEYFRVQKNLPNAYKYYKKAIELQPNTAANYLGLARVAFSLGKFQEALEGFEKNCQLTSHLHQEFRNASGQLQGKPKWQGLFRASMRSCNNRIK